MNPYLVLAAAAADWDRLAARLSSAEAARLAGLLERLREPGADGPAHQEAAEQAARLLLPLLPESGGAGAPRFTAGLVDVAHLGFQASDLAVLVLDGSRMVGPVLGEVRRRLLAAPALSAARVRELGGSPDAPDLLRLTGAGGEVRLPAFQFAEAATPRLVVLDVNALLGADRDPWGVTDWWLSGDALLGAVPSALLGTGHDDRLVEAARYLTEGE
ncbi:hypothetical protein [Kitasatospora sp. NPDC097691]|uniref:hypothetical protein n=1 Tax=Kitasatospora sp. NPDC097691 TaxID=3157231 RepID=UPI00331F8925